MTPESRFKKQAMGAIKEIPRGWFFTKEALGIRGIPDVIGLINGRFVALEFKKDASSARRKTGRTVLQRYNIGLIKKCGGYASFIFPENFHEVYEELVALAKLVIPK